jgi:Flp pilus assembly protein TadD
MPRQRGEFNTAVTALRHATRLDQKSAQAVNNIATAYLDKTRFEDAVEMARGRLISAGEARWVRASARAG